MTHQKGLLFYPQEFITLLSTVYNWMTNQYGLLFYPQEFITLPSTVYNWMTNQYTEKKRYDTKLFLEQIRNLFEVSYESTTPSKRLVKSLGNFFEGFVETYETFKKVSILFHFSEPF